MDENKYLNQTFTADHQISIPGDLFVTIMNLVKHSIDDGTRIEYYPTANAEDYEGQRPNVSLNSSAYIATLVEPKLRDIAIKNVDEGNSISVEELSKPKVKLVKG